MIIAADWWKIILDRKFNDRNLRPISAVGSWGKSLFRCGWVFLAKVEFGSLSPMWKVLSKGPSNPPAVRLVVGNPTPMKYRVCHWSAFSVSTKTAGKTFLGFIFVLWSWVPYFEPLTGPSVESRQMDPATPIPTTTQKKCIRTMGKGMGSISRCRIWFTARKNWKDAGNTLVELRANLPMSQFFVWEPTYRWSHSPGEVSTKDRTLRPSCCSSLRTKGGSSGGTTKTSRNGSATNRDKYMTAYDCNQRAVKRWYSRIISHVLQCIARFCHCIENHTCFILEL